jgi:hypothetical protein
MMPHATGAFKEGAHRETEKDRAKTKNDACRREAWSNLLTLYHATLSQQYGAIPEVRVPAQDGIG